jgi:hypothetical protein
MMTEQNAASPHWNAMLAQMTGAEHPLPDATVSVVHQSPMHDDREPEPKDELFGVLLVSRFWQ